MNQTTVTRNKQKREIAIANMFKDKPSLASSNRTERFMRRWNR